MQLNKFIGSVLLIYTTKKFYSLYSFYLLYIYIYIYLTLYKFNFLTLFVICKTALIVLSSLVLFL